jgi:hypothetical protein
MAKNKKGNAYRKSQEKFMEKFPNTDSYKKKIQDLKKKVKQLIIKNEGLIKKNKQLESTYILPYVDTDLHLLLNQSNDNKV